MDGQPLNYETVGTILEVTLDKPILPESTVQLDMEFNSQVPLQIRRSGRDSREGISYSMAQWYPKLAEYDYQGWHANPYIGREFYGVWGDFNVNITIDKSYIVAAGGVLQNPEEIGYGYTDEMGPAASATGSTMTYRFKADNVHDFMWAADPDYKHTKLMSNDGVELHFFFQENDKTRENWALLPELMNKSLSQINKTYGKYPYPVYYFIQGGDGGMEYPMGTLITGERSLGSLVGVSIHEWMHSWYHMILGTNESLYSWMDEGFTSYSTAEIINYLRLIKAMPGKFSLNPHERSVKGYARFMQSGLEEALTTHSDHFQTNQAYGAAAYTKGSLFLKQIRSIIGEQAFNRGMLKYYDMWKFKHPNPNDFIRIMEKESDLELDWFKEYWVQSTHQIDYGVDTMYAKGNGTTIQLAKVGRMPMPLDVTVTLADGEKLVYNIPLRIMRGDKSAHTTVKNFSVVEDWPWVEDSYLLTIDIPSTSITSVEIDEAVHVVDVDRANNVFPRKTEE